jgi:hypothetical protein
MQRINNDEVFFENIPFYGSNIVPKGSSGLGGEIYFNISEIDFFGGDVNVTKKDAGKEVYSLSTSNLYRFDKDNLLEYLDSIKDEFKLKVLQDYKEFTRTADQWKMIDEDGWNYRKLEIENASNLEFNMYLKKSTLDRGFIGCNSSDIYSLVIAYTLIPNHTELRIVRTNEDGHYCYTFLLNLKSSVDFASEFNQEFEKKVESERGMSRGDLLDDACHRGGKPGKSLVNTTVYYRDPVIAAAVKERANGKCDLCGQPAPFNNANGLPYLEEHHLIRLADGGDDSIDNAVALCPNCHRKMHIVKDEKDTEMLNKRILAHMKALNKK